MGVLFRLILAGYTRQAENKGTDTVGEPNEENFRSWVKLKGC